MTSHASDAILADLHTGLRPARRRIHRAGMRAAMVAALRRSAWMVVALGAVLLLIQIGVAVAGMPGALNPITWCGILATVVAAVFLVAAIRALLSLPTWDETAERLDLAARNHNRIAIALALAGVGRPSPFAQAAILDGVEYLRRHGAQRPFVPSSPVRSRRLLGVLSAGVALHVVAFLVHAGVVPGARGPSSAVAESVGAARSAGQTPEARPRVNESAVRVIQRTARASAAPAEQAPMAQTSGATPPADLPATAGAPGHGGRAALTPRTATGGLAAAAAGASSHSERDAGRPRAAAKSARPPETPRGDALARNDVSPINPGAAGSGAASPISHDWAQRESGAEREEEPASDEPVEDEQSVNTQRGGLQPSLKDRQEAPSRDLGMSGPPEGPPGTGRGGPTPPKKSRGTASLVLGVPIPDFVRGKIGPGTTRVIQERVTPVAMPGAPGRAVEVPERSVPESATARWPVAGELARVVRDYLIALHSADRQAASAPADADAGEATERSVP